MLWSDVDEANARQGLRNALHRIRSALGADVVGTSSEGLVAANTAIICDGRDFERALQDARWKDALSLYAGELLAGFHVPGAPEFERWLDVERRRFGDAAASAARSLACAAEAEGDVVTALAAARTACDLAPYDERSLRHLLDLMATEGERAQALRTFDDFVERLASDLGAAPSPQLQATVRAIRSGANSVVGPAKHETAGLESPTSDVRPAERYLATSDAPERAGPRRLVAVLAALALAVAWVAWSGTRSGQEVPPEINPYLVGVADRWKADTTHLADYLRAYALLDEPRITEARAAFQTIVREAPLYAPGWAGLSVAYYRSGHEDIPPPLAMAQARAAALRALALDPSLPDPMETLIAYDLFYRWDLPGAKARLDSAIATYPHYPEFHNLLATWHRFAGNLVVSLDIKEENVDRDPLSTRYAYQIAASLYFAHRCEEAELVYRRLPTEIRAPREKNNRLYRALACQGKDEEAALALSQAVLQAGDTAKAVALQSARSPESRKLAVDAVFRDRLERQLSRRREGWSPSELVMLQYAEMKHVDSTLVWLDSMYVERSMSLHFVPFDPLNDFMRDDPRFEEFLARLTWLDPAAS